MSTFALASVTFMNPDKTFLPRSDSDNLPNIFIPTSPAFLLILSLCQYPTPNPTATVPAAAGRGKHFSKFSFHLLHHSCGFGLHLCDSWSAYFCQSSNLFWASNLTVLLSVAGTESAQTPGGRLILAPSSHPCMPLDHFYLPSP